MRIRCWVRAISSRWTELTSSSCSRSRSRSRLRVVSSSPSRPARACSTAVRACGGLADRGVQATEHDADAQPDRLGGPALADHPLAALGGAGAGLALLPGGAEQPVGAAVQRAGALLGGAQRQPGVHLALAGGAGGLGEPLALGGVGLLLGAVLRGGEPGLQLGQPGEVALVGLLGLGDGSSRGGRPRRGRRGPASRTGRAPRPPRPASRRTRAAWPARRRRASARRGARPPCRRGLEGEPLPRCGRLGELGGGLVDRGLHLDQRRLGRGATGGEVRAEQVAVAGHRGDVGQPRRPAPARPAGRRRRRS